jgi:hypothetical protein
VGWGGVGWGVGDGGGEVDLLEETPVLVPYDGVGRIDHDGIEQERQHLELEIASELFHHTPCNGSNGSTPHYGSRLSGMRG